MLLLLSVPGLHPTPPLSQRRPGAPRRLTASVAADDEITKAKGNEVAIGEAASFFVEGFWERGTTTGVVQLSERERSELASMSCDDMMGRYGELVGARRLQSSLFVARGEAGDGLVGCVGVEAAMIDLLDKRVLSRAEGEALFAEEFAAMGGRERGIYRKMSAAEIAAELLPEYKVFGLLANLAVSPTTRRSGLARRLCERCDEATAAWDLPAISLQVDISNEAAVGLYKSLGYEEIFREEKLR